VRASYGKALQPLEHGFPATGLICARLLAQAASPGTQQEAQMPHDICPAFESARFERAQVSHGLGCATRMYRRLQCCHVKAWSTFMRTSISRRRMYGAFRSIAISRTSLSSSVRIRVYVHSRKTSTGAHVYRFECSNRGFPKSHYCNFVDVISIAVGMQDELHEHPAVSRDRRRRSQRRTARRPESRTYIHWLRSYGFGYQNSGASPLRVSQLRLGSATCDGDI
jgi:hypothetical protein